MISVSYYGIVFMKLHAIGLYLINMSLINSQQFKRCFLTNVQCDNNVLEEFLQRPVQVCVCVCVCVCE